MMKNDKIELGELILERPTTEPPTAREPMDDEQYGRLSIREKYIANATAVETNKGSWNVLLVEIYQTQQDGSRTKLGEYVRNYHGLLDTFVPFRQKGKEYALYSKRYTATRVMELPSCRDLCGEEATGLGFCPAEYYVPENRYDEDDEEYGLDGEIGFISGCVWGDDTSWKVQFLDLSKIQQGVLTRDERFGYIELLHRHKLEDAIDVSDYWVDVDDRERYISIASKRTYNLDLEGLPTRKVWQDISYLEPEGRAKLLVKLQERYCCRCGKSHVNLSTSPVWAEKYCCKCGEQGGGEGGEEK